MAKSWNGSIIKGACVAALLMSAPAARAQAPASGVPTADRSLDIYAAPNRLVALPDGRKMNIYCLGSGSPTIVLETGADSGGTMDWRRVQSDIAKKSRTCSYDRAGYAFSAPGPFPRDISHLNSDLHALLAAAGERGPFLLVGHSMGGPYVRAFARTWPGDVAGMVLIDSSSAGQGDIAPLARADAARFAAKLRDCTEQARVQMIRPGTQCMAAPPANASIQLKDALYKNTTKVTAFETLRSEYDGFLALAPATDTASLGAIPLTVLYVHHPEYKEVDVLWEGMQKKLATISSKGALKLVANSGHFIEIDQPQALIGAIDDVVDQVRGSTRH